VYVLAQLKLQITETYLAAGDCFGTPETLYHVAKSAISEFLSDVLGGYI
jgi:hypothetical protein